jgi:hypothetical protein
LEICVACSAELLQNKRIVEKAGEEKKL